MRNLPGDIYPISSNRSILAPRSTVLYALRWRLTSIHLKRVFWCCLYVLLFLPLFWTGNAIGKKTSMNLDEYWTFIFPDMPVSGTPASQDTQRWFSSFSLVISQFSLFLSRYFPSFPISLCLFSHFSLFSLVIFPIFPFSISLFSHFSLFYIVIFSFFPFLSSWLSKELEIEDVS